MTFAAPIDYTLPTSAFAWLAQILSSPAEKLRVRCMEGATSSTLFEVQVGHGGSRFVLRCLSNREWMAEEPDILERESTALSVLAGADFPAPHLVAIDPRGEACGVPSLLMTALPGQVSLTPTDFDAWLHELAKPLPSIHALLPTGIRWRYHPYVNPSEVKPPVWSTLPDLWARAIEIACQPWPSFAPAFIHRDYHPVNVLFSGNRISGVVDWPNACIGPADFDIAWCRLNLAFMYGEGAAAHFLIACAEMDATSLPYNPFWDILALIEVLPGPLEFYPPWAQFGLSITSTAELINRVERHLTAVIKLFDV